MKTVDFSEIIAASDLKVSRSRHLIKLIYWLLCFEQVYNQLINLPNKGIFGGRFISFAPLVIDRCIS